MNYIVYDLEFNQKKATAPNNPNLTFEIIQIGAVKLNENLEIISTFNRLIKPTVHLEIHPYIEDLTKISTEMVNAEDYFYEVYDDFTNFIGDDDFTVCTWGISDIKELSKNIKFHKLKPLANLNRYIDVQKVVSKNLHTPKGRKISLKKAIEFYKIPLEKDFHDALNDAYYTAEVFKKIYTPQIKTFLYSSENKKRTVKAKENINTSELFYQFEKMYHKKLSKEEQSMIKLAYIMGKTNQFIK